MNKKEYNGWTNYETWAVNLWIDNDEGYQDYWNGRARETGNEPFTTEEKAVLALEKELKADFEENNPIGDQANVWADLMNAALSEVNWHEIAEHYVNEVEIEEKEETEA